MQTKFFYFEYSYWIDLNVHSAISYVMLEKS